MRRIKKAGLKLAGGILAVMTAVSIVQTSSASYPLLTAYAVEFTVTEISAILYSNDKTKVYEQPDFNSKVLTVIEPDLPLAVTGITSNGWFRISLEGTFYVPGDGLIVKNAAASTDIINMTKGTFSFYQNPQLSDFDKNDVEDMDANTYIKYLDSFLMGYAMLDNCILQDSGRYLKDVYESQAKVDNTVANMSKQAYLINYRNNYLSNSLQGPFRNDRDFKLAMNRGIRYDISKFWVVYRNTTVGSDESKVKKVVEKVLDEIKAEQGVSFTYSLRYGDYKISNGNEGKGWVIEFTKKE